VVRGAAFFARRAAAFYTGDRRALIEDVTAAAAYHDFGKLDPDNQAVLRRVSRERLPIAHEDAGTAHLLNCGRNEAAVLVAGHHDGLFDEFEERKKGDLVLRKVDVAERVNHRLDEYQSLHETEGCPAAGSSNSHLLHRSGFERRIALSCLVDADHGDTAEHYGNASRPSWPNPRWGERLAALDRYVSELKSTSSRDDDRSRVYDACRTAGFEQVRSCEGPLGIGKTTAVMAYLLRVAHERGLRHIIVVLPYVSIIEQSVGVYRRALVLDGEGAEEIVARHDHQTDFDDRDLRHLAALWRSPIIVTTAVQFFETMASAWPAQLRKFHELPGSAVFIDEAHAALPTHLWPQVWTWVQEWTSAWGGYVVLASGSLPRFWERSEFVSQSSTPVSEILPMKIRQRLLGRERRRVAIQSTRTTQSLDELVDFVHDTGGPRLVILNTVQAAAEVAHRMAQRGGDVMHVSTALTPPDRATVLENVKTRLLHREHGNWTLVATSCVESGVDFSFRTAFRQTASVASLIQVSGRVNRNHEYATGAIWDVRLNDTLLPDNPSLAISQRVLRNFLKDDAFAKRQAADLALAAMLAEMTEGCRQRAAAIAEFEAKHRYPEVARLCRVIEEDTRLVVIDSDVADRIRSHVPVRFTELVAASVRMWASRLMRSNLPLEVLKGDPNDPNAIYGWRGAYDPIFLGYMTALVGGNRFDGAFIA
jgi:CRISPR-associated endonuclease/helicase Cas3